MKVKLVLGVFISIFVMFGVVNAQSQQPSPEPTPQLLTRKVVDKKFVVVSTVVILSSIYDAKTTLVGLKRCRACKEANVLMRPFVKSGPALYGVQMVFNATVIYSSYKMKSSSNPKIRKLWWILPVATIGVHATAGTLNLRFVF